MSVPLRFRLPGPRADCLNANGRIYPRRVLAAAIAEAAERAQAGLMFAGLAHAGTDRDVTKFYLPDFQDRAAFVTDCFLDERGQVWFDFEVIPTPAGRDVLSPLVCAGSVLGTSLVGSTTSFADAAPYIAHAMRIWHCDLVANPAVASTRVLPIPLHLSGRGPREVTPGDLEASVTPSRDGAGRISSYLESYADDLEATRSALEQALLEPLGAFQRQRYDALAALQRADYAIEQARQLLAEIEQQLTPISEEINMQLTDHEVRDLLKQAPAKQPPRPVLASAPAVQNRLSAGEVKQLLDSAKGQAARREVILDLDQ